MNRPTSHPFADFTRRVVRSLANLSAGVACGVAAAAAAPACGQDGPVEPFDFAGDSPARKYVMPTSDAPSNQGVAGGDEGASGFGLAARAGHVAGKTVGRDTSLTHIELMPYTIAGDGMLFGDLRFFRGNNDELGLNAGLGLRRFLPEWNKVLGASFWYDIDELSDGVQFEQLSLGLELLGENWDVRSNWYRPIGELTQVQGTSFVPGSARFEGYRLLFTQQTAVAAAAQGVDWLVTVPVRGEFFEKYDTEFSAGAYWYDSTDVATEALWGWRVRGDAGFFGETVHAYTELVDDDQTGTGVVFGISLDYHGGVDPSRRIGRSQKNRMLEWVRRNYNVVALEQPVIASDVTAINPDDGEPYFIAHVDQLGPDGTLVAPAAGGVERPILDPLLGGAFVDGTLPGTFENPFQTVLAAEDFAATQDEMVDIVFVAAGDDYVTTDFDGGGLIIPDNQLVFGEGLRVQPPTFDDVTFASLLEDGFVVEHRIPVEGLDGTLTLPSPNLEFLVDAGLTTPTPLNTSRPIFRGLVGDAVTAGSGAEFSGFIIDGTDFGGNVVTDRGLVIPGSIGGTFTDNLITATVGDGVSLLDASGNFIFNNFQLGTATLNGGLSTVGDDLDGDPLTQDLASQGAGGVGFLVQGGSPNVQFTGNAFGAVDSLVGVGNLIANGPVDPDGPLGVDGDDDPTNDLDDDLIDFAVLVDSTTGGIVNLAQATVVDRGAAGIRVVDTAGDTAFGTAILINTTADPTLDPPDELAGTAFGVLRSAGTTTLFGPAEGLVNGLSVFNPSGDALVVEDLALSGEVNGLPNSAVQIDQDPGSSTPGTLDPVNDVIGIRLTNIAGSVDLNGSTFINGPSADPGIAAGEPAAVDLTMPAVVFQSSTGAASIADLSVNQRGGGGVLVGDRTGAAVNAAGSLFELSGSASFNEVGLNGTDLTNTLPGPTGLNDSVIAHVGLVEELGAPNDQSTREQSVFRATGAIEIDDRGAIAIEVVGLGTEARASFAGTVSIEDNDDTAAELPSAVTITDNNAIVTFGVVTIEDARPDDNVVEINRNNRAELDDSIADVLVSFRDLNIVDADLEDSVASTNNSSAPYRLPPTFLGDVTDLGEGLSTLAHDPSAVIILDNDNVQIADGFLDLTGSRAVTAVNNLNTTSAGAGAEDFLTWEAINADDGGDFGVFLSNNRGTFEVNGFAGVDGSGGTISGYTTGYAFVDHDGTAELNLVEIEDGAFGVIMANTNPDEPFEPRGPVVIEEDDLEDFANQQSEFILDTSTVDNFSDAIRLYNVDEITVTDSVIEDFDDDGIEVGIFDLDPDDTEYDYEFVRNTFDDLFDADAAFVREDAINIRSIAGGDSDATLDLDVLDNIFDLSIDADAALFVDFDGFTDIVVAGNIADVGGNLIDNETFGFFEPVRGLVTLLVGDDDNTADILIDSNVLTQRSGNEAAIFVEMDGVGTLDVNNNVLEQTDDDGVVMRLAYDAGGTVTNITDNIFNQADGGVAIYVEDATPTTFVNISGNIFNLTSFGFTGDPEVILTADQPITVSGTGNIANGPNIIPVDAASIPNITGGFVINGTLFP